MRLLIVLIILGAACAQPSSRDPGTDPEKIEAGIRSNEGIDVAWAAFRIGSLPNRENAGELLRQALQRVRSLEPPARQDEVARFLLDAMMRFGGRVPVAELLPFYEVAPDAVLLLVARTSDPEQDLLMPVLLRAERLNDAPQWLLLTSILLRAQGSEFWQHLLEGIRFEFLIDLVEGHYLPVREPSVSFTGVIIGGIPSQAPPRPPLPGMPPPPPPWPPGTNKYCLSVTPKFGDTVISADPLMYLRRNAGDGDPCDRRWITSRNRESLRLLTRPEIRAFDALRNVSLPSRATVVWESPEKTRLVLERAVNDYVGNCRNLLAHWRRFGAAAPSWTDDELRSKISIVVTDGRNDRSIAIPFVEMVRVVPNR